MRNLKTLVVVIAMITFSSPLHSGGGGGGGPAAHYVATTGNDSNPCTTPMMACLTVQGAVDKAANGSTIYIGVGTFVGSISTINQSLTFSGAGPGYTFLDGDDGDLFHATPSGATASLSISGITFQNYAGSDAAINLDCSVGEAMLNATNVMFINNNATANAGRGGSGLKSTDCNSLITISRATFSGNAGGAIDIEGPSTTIVTLTNVTFYDNAGATGVDGVLRFGSGSVVTMNNDTIVGNVADVQGAIHVDGGSLNISNTLISDNGASSCSTENAGVITSSGHNISRGTSCNTWLNDSSDLNPLASLLLGSFTDYTTTFSLGTLPLLAGSPAIDGGDPAGPSSCEILDAISTVRADQGIACDVGALEMLKDTLVAESSLSWVYADSTIQTLVVSTPSVVPIHITTVGLLMGGPSFTITSTTCNGADVTDGSPCSISVRFNESAHGNYTDTLYISNDSVTSPVFVSLYGDINFTQSPDPVDFTENGSTDITFTNVSASGMFLGSPDLSDTSHFTIVSDGCSGSLAMGDSCIVNVSFSGTTGSYSSLLRLHAGAGGLTYAIPLSATISPPIGSGGSSGSGGSGGVSGSSGTGGSVEETGGSTESSGGGGGISSGGARGSVTLELTFGSPVETGSITTYPLTFSIPSTTSSTLLIFLPVMEEYESSSFEDVSGALRLRSLSDAASPSLSSSDCSYLNHIVTCDLSGLAQNSIIEASLVTQSHDESIHNVTARLTSGDQMVEGSALDLSAAGSGLGCSLILPHTTH